MVKIMGKSIDGLGDSTVESLAMSPISMPMILRKIALTCWLVVLLLPETESPSFLDSIMAIIIEIKKILKSIMINWKFF